MTASAPAGLNSAEAQQRLTQHGPNALPEQPPEPVWQRFLRQFQSPLIYVLLFALVFDLGLWAWEGAEGWPLEGSTIALILLLNAGLGVYQEYRSEGALARLRALAAPQVWVLRDGALVRLPSQTLVPGDWVRLEAGDRVPADGVLQQTQGVLLDESVLTGESVPLDKASGQEAASGSLLVRGKSYLEVTRTGASSNLGRLARMLEQVGVSKTPLEGRLDQLGAQIARWIGLLALGLAGLGVVAEGVEHLGTMVLFAVALAVAAIPEGLPAVLTLTLALGVERMARQRAVVRKLVAVEALGSVTVIATDKTGTLTENHMEVRLLDSPDRAKALKAMVLVNDAEVGGAGDPLELGLLRYAQRNAIETASLRAQHPRRSSHSFDSQTKWMGVTVQEGAGLVSYLKGAPEVLLERAALEPDERTSWQEKAIAYAAQGYRVLALAGRAGEAYDSLEFLGLVLFWDPPRPEVPQAIQTAQQAGIRVLMVSGDHPATALAVAREIGIEGEQVLTGQDLEHLPASALAQAVRDVNVFARVHPKDKLRLIEALQAQGQVVAMTGDGVNDAPALKRSDVGVAMGQRGSEVTREVADLVLLDDNFATIVKAIEEGRSIYENIQKFLRFLFSTNLAEVLVVGLGALLAFALNLRQTDGALLLPLLAVQILWINLVTDGLPALALALDRNPNLMQQPPKPPRSPLLDTPTLRFVLLAGGLKGLVGLGILGLLPLLGYGLEEARSACFHFLAIGQLFFVYPSRHTYVRPSPNPWLNWVVLGGVGLQVGVGVWPVAAGALGCVPLGLEVWGGILASGLGVWGMSELINKALWRGRVSA